MKCIAPIAVIATALLAPSSASAQSGAFKCPEGVRASSPGVEVSPSQIQILPGSLGVSPGYICVHLNGLGGEVVINHSDSPPSCSYINGWDTNPVPGYAGICTKPSHDPTCDGTSHGSGPNEGGCFWLKDAPQVVNEEINELSAVRGVTDMFSCGNTSGEDPQNTQRDGCFVP